MVWKISKEERQAIKSQEQDENMKILPADKGNDKVVMDKVEYSNNVTDLIGNGNNSKVKKEPDPEDRKEAVTDPK